MNLRQLEILRAVIRCETTVAASRELGLSQPAVSNAIKHMEAQLGFLLFERLNNRLFATGDARALYRDSDAILVLHKALQSKVRDLREHRAEKLRIVSTPSLGHGVIPLALRRFLERRARVRVSSTSAASKRSPRTSKTTAPISASGSGCTNIRPSTPSRSSNARWCA